MPHVGYSCKFEAVTCYNIQNTFQIDIYLGCHKQSVNRMAERPRLFNIHAEMRRWCALLEEEVLAWPEVSSKPMFGMTGLYHGKNIFAAIPKTKAPETPWSLLIKLPGLKQKRLKSASGPGKGWITFELVSADDIAEAIQLLERAYEENSP